MVPSTAPVVPLHTVAVDLSQLDRRSYDSLQASGLFKSLLVRLVEDDLAFVDASDRADIVVRLLHQKRGVLTIVVHTREGTRSRQAEFTQPDDERAHLELIHLALELVREARTDLPPASLAPGHVTGTADASRGEIRTQGGAASLWSGRNQGLLAEVEASVRRGIIALDVSVDLHQAFGLPHTLSVWEWGVFIGARTTHSLGVPWLTGFAGLNVGLWQQLYRYADGTSPPEQNSRFDLAGIARIGMEVEVSAWCRLGMQGGTLVTLHDVVHRTQTIVLWEAPHVRPFVGVVGTLIF